MGLLLLYFCIGEKMSLKNDELILNIKRQAKRLSKSLTIPLGQSQEMLAHVVYDCNGWAHLSTSLKSNKFDNELLLLSLLHPKAETLLFKLLNNNMSNIIIRFNVKFPEYGGTEEAVKLIVNLFGIELYDFERKIK